MRILFGLNKPVVQTPKVLRNNKSSSKLKRNNMSFNNSLRKKPIEKAHSKPVHDYGAKVRNGNARKLRTSMK